MSPSTQTSEHVPEVQTIGRAPVQFAGVTNGESLWALPNQQSPEASSDSNSVDDLMADIDWVRFYEVFSKL
jgi:hypothetical protein